MKGSRMILACPPKNGFGEYEERYKRRGNSETFIENRRKEFPYIMNKFENTQDYEKVIVRKYLNTALIEHGINLQLKKS